MLLSDGDRERLFDRLKAHAAAGTLDLPELERRVELVARAATREDAGAALEGLPSLPASAAPSGRRRRRRGHAEAEVHDPGWQATAERFRDPASGQIMRVWVDLDGGRHYVADEA